MDVSGQPDVPAALARERVPVPNDRNVGGRQRRYGRFGKKINL